MPIFSDRRQAGEILAQKLLPLKQGLKDPIVFGIPRGGIPVGFSVARALGCPLDTIVLRKLPIPDNPEAGFGAVTLNKTAIFNEPLLLELNLSKPQIDKIVNGVYKEVLRRDKVYRGDEPFPVLSGRSIILTDDGLASGYTMLAAVKFAKANGALSITVAVPVAHRQAYQLVRKEADKTVVLHISDLPFFAVASFYAEFPDLSDEEVVAYLKGQ